MEKPGETLTIKCSCGRSDRCPPALGCGALHVIPIKVDGEKRIDMRTIGMGGVVLSNEDRFKLLAILRDPDWFGEPEEPVSKPVIWGRICSCSHPDADFITVVGRRICSYCGDTAQTSRPIDLNTRQN